MTEGRQERGQEEHPRERAPRPAREQDAPEPERPTRPAEDAGVAPHQMEDPPQAEGERED